MPFDDLRAYLQRLEEDGQLQRVDTELRCGRGDNELQALMRYLHDQNNIALILNNLEGYNTPGVPIIFNPYGSRERTAMIMGTRDPMEAKIRHARILADRSIWHEPQPIERSAALCKEVIIPEADVDISAQVPLVWFGKEGPAFITNGVAVTKDPDTGARNVGWYRGALFSNAWHPSGGAYAQERERRCVAVYAFWNPPMSHIGRHVAKAAKAGKPLEIAFACSCDPALHLAAATGVPYGVDEYTFAGGLRGEPLDVVRCETVDLEVPATAEYILEGIILPGEEEPIGWHSNVAGYYDKVQLFPVMQVNCITHRKNPIWHATMEMVPPFDHNYIGLLPVESELLSDLQQKIPEVDDIVVTPAMTVIVQLNVDGASKPHAEFGKYILHAVWGASGRWGRTAKLVIVVGPDVDPYDWNQVEWAIMSRVQPYSDTIINRTGQAFVDDPSAPRSAQGVPMQSEQMGIDATIKVPERFDDYPEVSQADPAEVQAIAKKLRLTPAQ
jgi:3-polyprenyl-4-hydroxybenzoate decarboxylase